MDDNGTNLNMNTGEAPAEGISPAETPREVVLRYEAVCPQPVVERYVQPFPLPVRQQPAVPESEAPCPGGKAVGRLQPPRRARKLLPRWIALLVAAAMAAGLGSRFWTRGQDREPRPDAFPSVPATTDINRYPAGGDTRLRYAETHGNRLTAQEVYARVNPCTVMVVTELLDDNALMGTGIIFTADGYILTNAHVIAGGQACYVVPPYGMGVVDARLVGFDEEKDLAVLKIEAEGLPTAEFGDSDALAVGDTVYAIGNPLGVELRGTLTDGIVSAINRDVEVDGVRMTLIQTNAALNKGNSGGPLIYAYGQVVGINTVKMGRLDTVGVEGLGFAIPVSSAAWMVDDLIQYGEIRGEPTLGVLVQAVTLSSGEDALLICGVTEGSAADKAGLRTGDRIVRADGEPLPGTNDLLRIRRRYRAGDALRLEIIRDGGRLIIDVILEQSVD